MSVRPGGSPAGRSAAGRPVAPGPLPPTSVPGAPAHPGPEGTAFWQPRSRSRSRGRRSLLLPLCLVAAVGVALALSPVVGYRVLVFALTGVFLLYLLRHLTFLAAAVRAATPGAAAETTAGPADPLAVTVLIPCHNEAKVVDGLTAALAALDHPRHLLEVIFVDDRSTDGTGDLLAGALAGHPGWRLLRRPADAVGGKSAALNDALAEATGEVVVVFDADHQPAPDCLRELLRPFADPRVAAVQGRCVVRNPRDSVIARLVALDYLCGYLVNMAGRHLVHGLPAYGGANCAVRAGVLRGLGGWNVASVTEDTDLSLRIWLSGYRIAYAERAIDTELAVTTLGAYYRQRYRWARGHQQVCRDYRADMLRSPRLRISQKFEAALFLYVFHVPVLCVFALAVAAVGLAVPGLTATGPLWPIAPLMLAGPVLEIGGGMVRAGAARREILPLLLFPVLFVVSMVLCTQAVIDAWVGSRYAWVKTERTARDPNAAVSAA